MGFTVTYDPNGATGGTWPIDPKQYLPPEVVIVLGNTGNLTVPDGTFAYWNTAADGTGETYNGGDTLSITADITFYAQWFLTAGLTNGGITAHYAFSYDSALQKTAANPSGPEPARTNALIAVCESDYDLMASWFGGISLTEPVPVVTHIINARGGATWGGPLTLKPGSGDVTLCRYLMVSEVTEMFMLAQNKGWFAPDGSNEQSCGEGLSRFCAQQFLELKGLGFSEPGYDISSSWLNSSLPPSDPDSTQVGTNGYNYGSRLDYIGNTLEYDHGVDPATGCAMLFLYYLQVQLGFSINAIIAAAPGVSKASSCLAGVYENLTGDDSNPFVIFKQLLDEAFPDDLVSTIPGPNPDNPWPLGSLRFKPMLIASTKQNGLTSIGSYVSVNDSGSVAFAGSLAEGQGIFVADGIFSPGGRSQARNINPVTTGNPAFRFSQYVQINNAGKVLAQVRTVDGRTEVRVWDSHIADAYDVIALGGLKPPDKYDAVMSPASISNFAPAIGGGDVVFPALQGADTLLATPLQLAPAGTLFNDVLISGTPRPRISDNGQIVVRAGAQASSPIWVYDYNLTSPPPRVSVLNRGAADPAPAPGPS